MPFVLNRLPLVVIFIALNSAAGASSPTYYIKEPTPPSAANRSAHAADAKNSGARDHRMNVLVKADPRAGSINLSESDVDVRGFSVSPDGKQIVYNAVRTSKGGECSSELTIMNADGKVIKKIDLAGSKVRVFGTPMLLPGGKQIGVTIMKLYTPPPDSLPRGPARLHDLEDTQQDWMPGSFASQPIIATIDVESKEVTEIGPGALPCWSPDGTRILYSNVTVPNPRGLIQRKYGLARVQPFGLYEMKADGSDGHVISPAGSGFGRFSPDGTKIAFVRTVRTGEIGLFLSDGDGRNLKQLGTTAAEWATPMWSSDGASLLIARIALRKPPGRAPLPRLDANSVWEAAINNPLFLLASSPGQAAGLDVDADPLMQCIINLAPTNTDQSPAGTTEAPNSPAENPKLEFEGTRVYVRDAAGRRIPAPDGDYSVKGGRFVVHVRHGQRIIASN